MYCHDDIVELLRVCEIEDVLKGLPDRSSMAPIIEELYSLLSPAVVTGELEQKESKQSNKNNQLF